MVRVREVGSLWIGGNLSWMEQLCLKSFVDAGQKITLFHYQPIANVPEGVVMRDGREILDTDNFIKYEGKDSYALFADLFRLHMMKKCPGMIWVDTDVYCWRPLDYDSDYVFGLELREVSQGSPRINNAVLGLPADSQMLNEMLEFTSDQYAIPPFLKPRIKAEYKALADAGTPLHVSQQKWGVWGPTMVSYFARKLGLTDLALPVDAFYPVTFPERLDIIRAARRVHARITDQTTGMHLWASNKRELSLRHNGVPSKGSFILELMQKHGLRAEDAPLRSRGWRVLDGELAEQVNLEKVGVFADLGGRSRPLAYEIWKRFDAEVLIVDIDKAGRFPDTPSPSLIEYRDYLIEQGMDPARVTLVSDPAALRAADVVAYLTGFDRDSKLKDMMPVLGHLMRPGTLLFTDIRKGSGGFGVLRGMGSSEILSERESDATHVSRIRFRAGDNLPAIAAPIAGAAAKPATNSDGWAEIAATLTGKDGWFRDSPDHSFLYVPRGSDTLVVTFDNLDIAMEKREERRPWGFGFIEKQGWSMLGVMANGWTWYRDPWVWDQFDDLATSDFFDRYKRVVFYGASMGGYAACAFSAACPGCEVVAISPQSTLDKTLVPWETRYVTAWNRDFSGPYGDAAQVSAAARRVTLLYDPYEPLDAGHVARFENPNVLKLRAPLLGHRLGSSLQQMGILSPITLGALNGTLSEVEFYRTLRARKSSSRYQKELFKKVLARGHVGLARRMGRWVLTRGDNRFIRKELAALG
ncbi:hypothetical protein [Gemmobacter denitrificans]|uniref:Uncharacterized protein n=1 Tax=Gemmobacter denitrificans TaxID=3123040 RepID=A0ABU8BPT8_9RHOB